MKKFFLIHKYLETGFVSIIAFSNNLEELIDIRDSQPYLGSYRHEYSLISNDSSKKLNLWKDSNLINICKNVAQYLAVGEYAMFKKSYFKSAAWFEKAKNSASLGAEIIENY